MVILKRLIYTYAWSDVASLQVAPSTLFFEDQSPAANSME
jgi:hypothetical protein